MDIKITDLKKYLLTKTDKELREEINRNNLGDVFEKRLRKVVAMSSDIGWGFGDFLQDYYYQHFDLEMDK